MLDDSDENDFLVWPHRDFVDDDQELANVEQLLEVRVSHRRDELMRSGLTEIFFLSFLKDRMGIKFGGSSRLNT